MLASWYSDLSVRIFRCDFSLGELKMDGSMYAPRLVVSAFVLNVAWSSEVSMASHAASAL